MAKLSTIERDAIRATIKAKEELYSETKVELAKAKTAKEKDKLSGELRDIGREVTRMKNELKANRA